MRHPIKTSKKDFQNKKRAYPSTKYALKEIVTNAFFAPKVKSISLNFVNMDKPRQSFWFTNDGTPMTKDQIFSAISEYGCESASTAGNENGMGLKSSASYFAQFSKNSMLVLASKKRGSVCGIGWIDPDGQYCEYEDFTVPQREFVDSVLATFTTGTVTMVYDTEVDVQELEDFKNDLQYMFTSGLDAVNFTWNEDGISSRIKSFDRHYTNLPYVRRRTKDVVFEYKKKLHKCTLISTDTRSINANDYKSIDETNRAVCSDFGIHMGYDNGYMPIHLPQVEIIGYESKPQYYYMRGSLIAHPVENDPKYASVDDWKSFFSDMGNMSQQKVPNLSKKKNYFHTNGKIKESQRSLYETVISEFRENVMSWLPSSVKTADDKYGESKMKTLNILLEKNDFRYCDSTWKFRFGYNVEDVVKFDAADNTVVFKFDEESPLLKKLIKGGRDGRNGSNDLDVIIVPTIDVFKMDIEDQCTTDKVIGAIRKKVRQFNNYYSK